MKIVIKVVVFCLLIANCIFFVPRQFKNGFDLMNKYLDVKNLENKLSDSSEQLISSSELYKFIEDSGATILLSSIHNLNVDTMKYDIKSYSGEELEPSNTRILELFLSVPNDQMDFFMAYLYSIGLSYNSIDLSNNEEIVLRVYVR